MIRSAKAFLTAVPLKRVFVHAHASRAVAENLFFTVDVDGSVGVGESIPRDYVTGESIESAFQAVCGLDLKILDQAVSCAKLEDALVRLEALKLDELLEQKGQPGLAASCAVETAVLDALGRKFSVPVSRMLGLLAKSRDLLRDEIPDLPMAVTLGYDRSVDEFKGKLAPAVNCIKIKAGRDDDEDCERVRATVATYGPKFQYVLDVNMAWSLDRALAMAERLKPYRVFAYEQPFPKDSLSDSAAFRRHSGCKVLLDESVCSYDQAMAALESDACDMLNMRVSKCGGLIRSVRMAELASARGIGVFLGGHPGQNGVMTAVDRAFATSIRGILTCESLFISRNVEALLVKERILEPDFDWGRTLSLPGIGVAPDFDLLDRYSKSQLSLCPG